MPSDVGHGAGAVAVARRGRRGAEKHDGGNLVPRDIASGEAGSRIGLASVADRQALEEPEELPARRVNLVSEGGLGHRNVAHLRQAGVHVVDDSSIRRSIQWARGA
jgi:hypothetical protein